MTGFLAATGAWLLGQSAAPPETLFVRQVAVERGWFEQLMGVASGLASLTLLVLAAFLIPAAWNFRASFKRTTLLLDRIHADINPIIRHASSIADNVDYVTTTVRADVQRINATVASANQRVQEAVAQTEARVREFNALLSVVQEEAEDLFVSTASTVRGVRRGAAALSEDDGPEIASLDDVAAEIRPAAEIENKEEPDVDDHRIAGKPATSTAGGRLAPTPRLRQRREPRGR